MRGRLQLKDNFKETRMRGRSKACIYLGRRVWIGGTVSAKVLRQVALDMLEEEEESGCGVE